MKKYKNDLAKLLILGRKLQLNPHIYENTAINVCSNIKFAKEFEVISPYEPDGKMNFHIDLTVYLEEYIYECSFGEEKQDKIAQIGFALFGLENKCIACSCYWDYYTFENVEKQLNQLLQMAKNPAYLESEHLGKGYGFKMNDSQYFAFLDKEMKKQDVFKQGSIYHINNFEKIEELECKPIWK